MWWCLPSSLRRCCSLLLAVGDGLVFVGRRCRRFAAERQRRFLWLRSELRFLCGLLRYRVHQVDGWTYEVDGWTYEVDGWNYRNRPPRGWLEHWNRAPRARLDRQVRQVPG